MPINARRISGVVAARGTSAVLQFGTLLVITRHTSIGSYGNYAASIGQGAVIAGISALGLPPLALRMKDDERGRLIPEMLGTTVVSSLMTSAVVIILSLTLFHPHGWWLIAAGTFVGTEMLQDLGQNILFSMDSGSKVETFLILRRAVPLVFIVPSFFWGSLFAWATVGYIVSAVILLANMPSRIGWPRDIRRFMRDAIPFWVASLSAMLQQLDVSIVNLAIGTAAAGAYGAAFRLASPVHIVTSSLIGVMLPALMRAQGTDRISQGNRYSQVGVLYAIILVVFSPVTIWLGPKLVGSAYSEYSWIFPALIINSALSVVNQIYGARLVAEGLSKYVAKISVIATLVGLMAVVIAASFRNLPGTVLGVILIQVVLLLLTIIQWFEVVRSSRHGRRVEL